MSKPIHKKENNTKAPQTKKLLQPHLLSGYHTRGYLPHLKIEGATYWITFHLADSIPQSTLNNLKEELNTWLTSPCIIKLNTEIKTKLWKQRYAKRIQQWLDAGMGACWLKRDDIGKLVVDALLHFAGKRYELLAWVVMPNHVHVLVTPRLHWTLSSIEHSWKSYTASMANKILKRVGQPFWHIESYDHIVRNERKLEIFYDYTIYNPVKAGLCKRPEDWPFSSIHKYR